ncbi:unnamed protein product [Closterium sp. NIES-54]
MARLLTALVLLLAVTVTLASLASTAAARSVRLLGASGAVDTAVNVITAESAPSGARSRDDEQSRRKLGWFRNTAEKVVSWANDNLFSSNQNGQGPAPAVDCSTKYVCLVSWSRSR